MNFPNLLFSLCLLIFSVFILNNSTDTNASAAVLGGDSGGGGDATEIQVDEIRSEILRWIENAGGQDILFPPEMTYDKYASAMKSVLQPHAVIVGFIEKDSEWDDELRVSVSGFPKTCRSFHSRKDLKKHILCNIARFENSSESDQYKLIHHEYASLAGIEKNDGASSDYFISKQLSDYFVQKLVLCLSIKKLPKKTSGIEIIHNPKYPGSNRFFSASVPSAVFQSSENGVCRVLGFEKAVEGSSRTDFIRANTIQIDFRGQVLGGDQEFRLTEIVCLNRIIENSVKQLNVITANDLVDDLTGRSFSASSKNSTYPSSEDGVCKLLGFKKAVPGSSRTDKKFRETLQVDFFGEIVAATFGPRMLEIVCL